VSLVNGGSVLIRKYLQIAGVHPKTNKGNTMSFTDAEIGTTAVLMKYLTEYPNSKYELIMSNGIKHVGNYAGYEMDENEQEESFYTVVFENVKNASKIGTDLGVNYQNFPSKIIDTTRNVIVYEEHQV
jgi:hypothetical protein